MPKTHVVFFRELDGPAPVLDWISKLPVKALDECAVRVERLQDADGEVHSLTILRQLAAALNRELETRFVSRPAVRWRGAPRYLNNGTGGP